MRSRGLIFLIVLLITILILEGVAIGGVFDPYLYPTGAPSGPTTPTTPGSQPSQPTEEPSEEPGSLIGTRVYEVSAQSVVPAGQGATTYTETHRIAATPSATGRSISIEGIDTQSPPNRSIARIQIEPDGSYFLTFFETTDGQATFTCEGSVPGYLVPGRNTAEATLDCNVDGQSIATFVGTANASGPTPYSFDGTQYQARTVTVSGTFGTGIAQGLEFVSAPGIGTLEIRGSLGDLVFGSFGGPVSAETQSVLVEAENTTLFVPS